MAQEDAFVFMKVGSHAGETFEQILARKNAEFEKAGKIFWGYGGSACHPIQQVQPFVKSRIAQNAKGVYLLMQSVISNADPDILPAQEYSEDGLNWKPVPEGISVTGSRYALVLDEITPESFFVDTSSTIVGIGPSRGKTGDNYMKGRTDKACLIGDIDKSHIVEDENHNKAVKKISFAAKLQAPYAVMLRGKKYNDFEPGM